MTEKRFFILRDDVYNTSPCIRERTFELKDIYGHFKYDDINEICDFMNKLVDENEQLKTIKNQYKGQKEYLLWVIGRNCPKVLFDIVKSHLKDIEGGDVE